MGTYSIIWDFDGTLLPNDPYDSEQSLMLHKLDEDGENIPAILRGMARMMIYADNKEFLRKRFKRFYVWFMKGTHVSVLDQVSERLAAKISAADRKVIHDLKRNVGVSVHWDFYRRVLHDQNRWVIIEKRQFIRVRCVPPIDTVPFLIQGVDIIGADQSIRGIERAIG